MAALCAGPVACDAPVDGDVPAGGPTAAITPADPLDGEPLTCTVSAGATLRWTVDGADWPGSDAVVPAGVVRFGETWTCEATAADGAVATASVQVADAPRPNVLVVLVDDLGTQNLAVYGDRPGQPVTPTIDSLAAEGLRFDAAWAMPMCTPARAALLTGRMPRRYGLGNFVAVAGSAEGLPYDEVTIPEMLAAAPDGAYGSAVVGKWHLAGDGFADALDHPRRQGFDHARVSQGNLGTPSPFDGGVDYDRWPRVVDGVAGESQTYATTQAVDDALDLLPALSEPWFLLVAFHAPHVPLHIPPEDLLHTPVPSMPSKEQAAAAMVEAVDTELGRLLAGLGDARDDTLVLFAADNGEAAAALTNPGEGLKGTLYESGVRVPMIASGREVLARGEATSALVSIVDVFPTVAALAGVHLGDVVGTAGGPDVLDGVSFQRVLRDPDASVRDALVAERFRPNGPGPYETDVVGVRDDRFKLIDAVGEAPQFFPLDHGVEGPALDVDGLSGEAEQAFVRLRAVAAETRGLD